LTTTTANWHFIDQPLDCSGLVPEARDELIITTVHVDGIWQVLSRYGDDVWILSGGPTNRHANQRRLDFNKVPYDFRSQFKAMLYRYQRRGRAGSTRPGASSMKVLFTNALPFFSFLESLHIRRVCDVTPMLCATYAQACAERKSARSKPLSKAFLTKLYEAVEALFELSQHTDDPMLQPPWPESSAAIKAGTASATAYSTRNSTTPLIPDEVFCSLFAAAQDCIAQHEQLLSLRDSVQMIEQRYQGRDPRTVNDASNKFLKSQGWFLGVRKLRSEVRDIRTACYIIVASLSGCRNHEIAFIQRDACYKTEAEDGEEYWWFNSRSMKTDAGHTAWMIPEEAVTALKVMDRWAVPFQAMIDHEIAQRRIANPADTGIAEAQAHRDAVFLGVDTKKNNLVRTLSLMSWNSHLNTFAKKNGIVWKFASHQFRRKFANYAARSKLGDLRYLKQHFKHWAMDMTLLYALNEAQEMALFIDVLDDLDILREGKIAEWTNVNMPLSGGAGNSFTKWRRRDDIHLFASQADMVQTIAENISIRSNGHAWCTADSGIDCIGNGGLDRIRCSDCSHSIIEPVHIPIYQRLYDQLALLKDLEDIGESGRNRVKRDLARCAKVLQDLGYDPEQQKPTL